MTTNCPFFAMLPFMHSFETHDIVQSSNALFILLLLFHAVFLLYYMDKEKHFQGIPLLIILYPV